MNTSTKNETKAICFIAANNKNCHIIFGDIVSTYSVLVNDLNAHLRDSDWDVFVADTFESMNEKVGLLTEIDGATIDWLKGEHYYWKKEIGYVYLDTDLSDEEVEYVINYFRAKSKTIQFYRHDINSNADEFVGEVFKDD